MEQVGQHDDRGIEAVSFHQDGGDHKSRGFAPHVRSCQMLALSIIFFRMSLTLHQGSRSILRV